MSKYKYIIISKDEENEKDICLVVEANNEQGYGFKPIARILKVDQYENLIIENFIAMYIAIFEDFAEETEDGNIIAPVMREWDLDQCMDDILYWRKYKKIKRDQRDGGLKILQKRLCCKLDTINKLEISIDQIIN